MQFSEGLSDREAADAVGGHIDWKYALSLELADSGFDFSVLSEFRSRLVAGKAEYLLFETMLNFFKQKVWLRPEVRCALILLTFWRHYGRLIEVYVWEKL